MPDPFEAAHQAYSEQMNQAATIIDALQADLDRLRQILGVSVTRRTRTAPSVQAVEAPRRRGRAKSAATATRSRTKRPATSDNGTITVDIGKSIVDLVAQANNKLLAVPLGDVEMVNRGRGVSCRIVLSPDQALGMQGELKRLLNEVDPSMKPRIRKAIDLLGA